ncbi:MAG: RNA polymerase subunit sigma [Verrucomicrobiales bacterium]|nr:RNA polymerase subunit sigma [Verrucomicrobiales bacterium]|tara:strand:+ start:5226 stop:6128 length:903 start_codon:yes stop_codon:yes gene_type:complete
MEAKRPKRFTLPDSEPIGRATTTGDSAFERYLRDACQEPLLTVEDEWELADRIKNGDNVARERMIKANLRLVVKIAREYEGLGLPLLDLINEGNIGLMRAVDKFDPSKGGKLSTYSSWWIKQQMRRAITNQSKTIRMPIHAVEKVWNLRRISDRYQRELGREPSTEELSVETGISRKKIAAMMESSVRPASLDAPIGDDDSSTRSELIADAVADNPANEFETKNSVSVIGKLMQDLTPREFRILSLRFGLEGGEGMTLTKIGEEFGVTRERIRQLQNGALTRLREMMENLNSDPLSTAEA